jgi:hypothetical protein
MLMMRSAINDNGLTRLQSVWGGSHDAILGLLLWLYSIPTYSLEKFFKKKFFYLLFLFFCKLF